MHKINIYIKIAVSYLIYYSGLYKLLKFLKRKKVHSLCYHRIVENFDEEKKYSLSSLLVSKSSFIKQIGFLKKEYNIISMHDFLYHLEEKKKLPNNSLLITFDDGYRDNYTIVYPILKKFNIPAVIFLSTHFLDSRDYPEWEKKRPERLMLSWEEVNEMVEHDILFGAHTEKHEIYTIDNINNASYDEIVTSKNLIKNKINKDVHTFAFPEGTYNEKALETAKKSGYKAVFSLKNKNRINSDINYKQFVYERIPINEGMYNTNGKSFHAPIFACGLLGLWS